MLDKNVTQPLYLQLVDILIDKIGNMDAGEQLPSERELCLAYGVSRTTVRQAISELKFKDYVHIVHGQGIFAAKKEITQKLDSYYSFTLEMVKRGKVPKTLVLTFDIVSANNEISSKLNLNAGDLVYIFKRLRLADDIPMMVETSYVPYEIFPGIVKKDLDLESLYSIFENRFKITVEKAQDSFMPIIIKPSDADSLKVNHGSPALKIFRLSFDKNERVLEYTVSVVRGDKYIYSIVVNK